VRVERIALKYHGDIARAGREVGDHPAVDHDVAGGGPLQPGDHAHQRGLAASGRTEQHEELALLRNHVDAIDGAHFVEQLCQAAHFNSCHDLRRRPFRRPEYDFD